MKAKFIMTGFLTVFLISIFTSLFPIYFALFEGIIIYILGCILILIMVFNTRAGKNTALFIRGGVHRLRYNRTASKLRIAKNVQILHPECVSFGSGCDIAQNVVFAPLKTHHGKKFNSRIVVGNRVHFGPYDRIASMNEVIIEDDVLFAAFVHVTDHSHDYRDITKSVTEQGVFTKGPVVIKKGSWLAFGCHVLSGVTIGEHSVVAANAVVTKDVPAYTVVAGNPARIVCQYDFEKNAWVHISKS